MIRAGYFFARSSVVTFGLTFLVRTLISCGAPGVLRAARTSVRRRVSLTPLPSFEATGSGLPLPKSSEASWAGMSSSLETRLTKAPTSPRS